MCSDVPDELKYDVVTTSLCRYMYVCFIHILPNGLGDAIINYSFIGSLLVFWNVHAILCLCVNDLLSIWIAAELSYLVLGFSSLVSQMR